MFRRFVSTIFLLVVALAVWSQQVSHYEYWIDDDYASRTSESSSQEEVFALIDVGSMPVGVHFLNFRATNSEGETCSPYRYLFYVPDFPDTEATLATCEYWLDDDYDARQVAEGATDNTFSLDVSALSTGVHFFNCRVRNTAGEYSAFHRYLFYVPDFPDTEATLATCEYWLDDDYETRTVLAGSNTEQSVALDVSAMSSGIHFFNFRAFLSDGSVGTLTRLLFYVSDDLASALHTDVVGYQYAFNSLSRYVEVTKGESFGLNTAIPIPDAREYAQIDQNTCKFTFGTDSVRMTRRLDVCFTLRFVNEVGGWSTPETCSFVEEDSIAKPLTVMPLQKSVFLDKVSGGDYQAVRFTLPASGKYYFRATQLCDMDIYNASGKLITTIKGNSLRDTYAAQLVKGDYYGIIYNTVTDAGNSDSQVSLRVMTTNNVVPTPEISFADGQVSITCAQEDALIYYTTDDTNPTDKSTRYVKPFALDHNAVVRAIALAESYTESNVARYVVDSYKVSLPVIEFANLRLYMSCETEGAAIYYTTDGSDPLEKGVRYEAPLSVAESCTVKAVARREGYNPSEVVVYELDITNVKCIAPELLLSGNLLTMTTLTEGASIYYTTDGTTPHAGSKKYLSPIMLDRNAVYKAIAMKSGELPSDVSEVTVDWFQAEMPRWEFADGILTLTCSTPGAVIYYTIGGEEPTAASTRYTGPVTLSDNRTVKAFAVAEGFNDSEVVTFRPNSFTCETPVMAFDGHTVTLSSATPEAKIYYTLNGTDPTDQSTPYGTTFNPGGLCTVKAVAIREDMNSSHVMTCTLPCYYDGGEVYVAVADSMEKAFAWCGLPRKSALTVHGTLGSKDFATLRKMAALEHLDLSSVTLSRLDDQALASMSLISVSMPSTPFTCGSKVLGGCTRLAAIEWNSTTKVPEDILGGMQLPNLLLYVKNVSVASASFKNVVVGTQAEEIVLSDTEGSNFYCLREFTARSIRYTHTYGQKTVIGQCTGWESIALPFAPTSITHAVNGSMSPFAAQSKEDKPFWLCELTHMGFESADRIEANKPYLIAMPNNDKYSDEYILAGEVTFSGKDVKVLASSDLTTDAKDGNIFTPNFVYRDKATCMTLNVGEEYDGHLPGSLFASNYRQAKPFEAYVTTTGMMSRKQVWFIEDQTTGLEEWNIPSSAEITLAWAQGKVIAKGTRKGDLMTVHDLNGRLLNSVTATGCRAALECHGLTHGTVIVRVTRNGKLIKNMKYNRLKRKL